MAAKVLQIKNGKALIDLQGDVATSNQEFFLVNSANKKTAIIRILQVRGSKAVAVITKGKALGGETLLARAGAAASATHQQAAPQEDGGGSYAAEAETSLNSRKHLSAKTRNKRMRISAVFNMMMNNMSAVESPDNVTTETVGMKGSSFGITGAIDYPMWPSLTLRGTVGYEPYTAAGTAKLNSCNNKTSTDCNANITYIAFGGYLRYDILKDPGLLWVAAGGTMRMPMGKSSTALNESDIALTASYGAAVGYDIFLNNNKNFIPLSFELQYFLPSDTVKTDFMSIRGGYGFVF